jgi:hypothetical protein
MCAQIIHSSTSTAHIPCMLALQQSWQRLIYMHTTQHHHSNQVSVLLPYLQTGNQRKQALSLVIAHAGLAYAS